jgi:hypothetical protein
MGRPADRAATGERRRYQRFSEEISVLFAKTPGSAAFHAGRIRDVSLGGLCLGTSHAWEVGTRLYLGIFWEGEPDPLVAVARVRRCVPEAEGFTLGLKFLLHTSEQQRAIERLSKYLRNRHGDAATSPPPPAAAQREEPCSSRHDHVDLP